MKKIIKILIILEVQVIILLFIIGHLKLNELEKKVYNTNKFMHELIINKQIEELKKIAKDDILIGEKTAPITMFLFSRYGCSACSSFYENIYPQLRNEYIEKGLLKIVVRQMVHTSRPKILYAAKAALYSYQIGIYEEFNYQIQTSSTVLKNEFIDSVMYTLIDSEKDYDKFMSNMEIEKEILENSDKARKAGIKGTPSFLIGDEKIYGTRSYKRFKAIIDNEIER